MGKYTTLFHNQRFNLQCLIIVGLLSLGIVGCNERTGSSLTVEEKIEYNDVYQETIEKSVALLEENYTNEQALVDFASASLLSHGSQYEDAVGKDEQTEVTKSIRADYKKLATYAYSCHNNTSPQKVEWEEIYDQSTKAYYQTGTVVAEMDESGIIGAQSTLPLSNMNQKKASRLVANVDQVDISFPYNTCPPGVEIVGFVIAEFGLTIQVNIDWHQLVANEVYYRWVDDRLARGYDPKELTWDIYTKLDWLREDFPHWFDEPQGEEDAENNVNDKEEVADEDMGDEVVKTPEENEPTQEVNQNLTVITEEEFQAGVMFNTMVNSLAADDEFTKAVIDSANSIMGGFGYTNGSGGRMIGRSHPIRFGEDVDTAAGNIAMDMYGILNSGGSCYQFIGVDKAANGYIFKFEVEKN